MKKNKTGLFLLVFFILLSAGFMIYYYGEVKKNEGPEIGYIGGEGHGVGQFAFVNQEGDTITNEDVKDKIYIVEYFFTTCKGICPKMNENMSKVYEAFRGNEDVKILSHTVDPKKDTVEAMKAYSLRFDAEPDQWMFLTGDKKELYDMARYSYLVTAATDTTAVDIEGDFIHTEKFILVDRYGKLRGAYTGTDSADVSQLISDVKTLLKEQP